MAKEKDRIEYRIVYDTREQSLDYLKYFKADSRVKQDGTKFTELICDTVKPLGCNKSTGDMTYEYSINNSEFKKSNLCLEIKKKEDLISSLYTKASYDRLVRELDRAYESGLEFHFIYDWDITKVCDHMKEHEDCYFGRRLVKKRYRANGYVTWLNNWLKFQKELEKRGFEHHCSGNNMFYLVKRLIKNNLKNVDKD